MRSSLSTVFCLALVVCLPPALRAQTPVISLDFNSPSNGYLTQSGSTSGITFTNGGAVTFGSGQSGTGAIFNGTQSSSLSSSASPAFTNFTITLWMNTTVTNGGTGSQWYYGAGLVDHEIGGVTNDWGISQVGNRVAFGVGASDTTIFSTSNVNTGTWTFVAASWNGSTGAMSLYINGTKQSTATGPTGVRNYASGFLIGRDINNSANSFYSGSLDGIRLYDSVLSDATIGGLYTSAIPEPSTYAALFGAAALTLAVWRKRRRSA